MLSVIYMAPVVLFSITGWPTEEEAEDRWVYNTIEIILQPGDSNYEIRETYKDLSNQELVKRIHDKYGKEARFAKQSFTRVDEEYEKELLGLTRKRSKIIGVAFMSWVAPVIVVYILGIGIGWVYRGFKSGKTTS